MTEEQLATALRRAFDLGQRYWMQADSESYAESRRSDETLQTFNRLVSETRAALAVKPQEKQGEPATLPIKGAWIDGGYVIVTPTGFGMENARVVRDAILALAALAEGWKRVHGRTERQMLLQLLALMAGAPVPAEPVTQEHEAVPGMVLVPVEPTEAMVLAGVRRMFDALDAALHYIDKGIAALVNTPTEPKPEAQGAQGAQR